MIDRYLVRYFLAVIDHGNFSKAAAHCNVSQPTLSVGIGKLERLLGGPLFLRTNRRVELTESGARLAPHARRIEADFAIAEREVRGGAIAATIRLGVLTTTPSRWIERFLEHHLVEHGEERIEIVEARERDLLERLGRGRIDIALTITRGGSRFAGETLFTERYSLAMAKTHRLAGSPSIAAEDLAKETMIVRRQCELLSETSRYFTARGVRPFFPARTTSEDRALAYVRSGLGITVMPDSLAGDDLAIVPLDDFPHTRDIGFLLAPHANGQRLFESAAIRTLTAVLDVEIQAQTAFAA